MSGSGQPRRKVVPLWHAMCQLGRGDVPIANLYNACLGLRHDPAYAGKFRFDEMLRAIVNPAVPITDTDVYAIREWLQENGLKHIGTDDVRQAIDIVAHEHEFHPLLQRLEALEWDGEPRTASWMHFGLGTDDDEYHRQVGQCFLIAMVRRIFEPGGKMDYMLVLEGPQGTLKSTACRILSCGYFSDTLPDLAGDYVRVQMHLRGKWVIEVSEFSAFDKAHHNRLKSFLTTPEEKYTPKFARYEVIEPRQCVFIATTNDSNWLRDDTGGRRYWPVICGRINTSWLEANIDQLLAEAVDAHHRRANAFPEPAVEDRLFKPRQAARLEVDPWENPIRDKLSNAFSYTLVELADQALNLKTERLGTRETRRMVAILKAAGWEQFSTGLVRAWRRK